MTTLTLLTDATDTSPPMAWPGGIGFFSVGGNIEGGVVKLQYLGADGVTWMDAGPETSLSAPGAGIFELPALQIRAYVGPRSVNGRGPTGVYALADTLP